jgi:hypothetical protein
LTVCGGGGGGGGGASQSNNGAVSGPARTLNNSQQCSQKNQMQSCDFEDDVFHSQVPVMKRDIAHD